VDKPTLKWEDFPAHNKHVMAPVPSSRIVLKLTAAEADALLQVLLESPVPVGVDESVLNEVLMQLAESLPERRGQRHRTDADIPLAVCR